MQMESIRLYIEFCKYMNFTKAAEKLNISQPALSYHISALEKELGVILVDRKRPTCLTPTGEHFFQRIHSLYANYLDIAEEVRSFALNQGEQDNTIRIKSPVLVAGEANRVFESILRNIMVTQRNLNLKMAPSNSKHFIDEMISGNLNCVLCYSFSGSQSVLEQYYLEPTHPSLADIDYYAIAEVPFAVAVKKGSPLAEKERLTLKDLENCRVLYDHTLEKAELLLHFASVIERYGINIKLKPAIIQYSGLYTINLEENEMLFSSPDYPTPEDMVCKEFDEALNQTIYVAVRNAEDNEFISLFKSCLEEFPGVTKA
jgi:DNA-binding transcriptional LysR family regulator